MRSLGLSTSLPLKSLVNWAHFFLFIGICLRLSTLVPGFAFQWAYTYYQMIVSFDAVLMMCEMFTFMWTSVNFGTRAAPPTSSPLSRLARTSLSSSVSSACSST